MNAALIILLCFTAIFRPTLLLADDFMGFDCIGDCSGHEAGYEWAEENDIEDSWDCEGKSDSFNEGCEAYLAEQEEEAKRQLDYSNGDDDPNVSFE